MKITPATIRFHELIGLEALVIRSNNSTLKNVSGKVVDESKNVLRLFSKDRTKIIPKANSAFLFKLPDGTKVIIHGSLLIGRPEDRAERFR